MNKICIPESTQINEWMDEGEFFLTVEHQLTHVEGMIELEN